MATYGTWIIYPSKGDGKSILFDTGQSGRFIDNARDLGIDLKGLNYVVISHGHYDHSGGLERLIKEVNPNIRLYVGSGFFEKDLLNITGNLLLFSNFNRDEEFENTDPKMYIKRWKLWKGYVF